MTTYRGHRLDTIQAADGWHAYVDMHEVATGSTCDDALEVACRWIDAALNEQLARRIRTEHLLAGIAENAPRGAPMLRLINCDRDDDRLSFRGGNGTI